MWDDKVNEPCKSWQEAENERVMVRTLYSGQRAVWDASTKYLPLLPYEKDPKDPRYLGRLGRARFMNKVRDAVKFAVATVFKSEVQLEEDVPKEVAGVESSDNAAEVEGWAENIDLRGNNLTQFLADRYDNYWRDGLAGWLVDMPPAPLDQAGNPRPITAAELNDFRPYWIGYEAKDVINWRYDYPNGRRRLVMLALRSWGAATPTSRWHTTQPEQVRVYYAPEIVGDPSQQTWTQFEVWEKQASETATAQGQWKLVEKGQMATMTEIPFAHAGELDALPPLLDLAYENLFHYMKDADRANIEFTANVPVPYVSGANEEQMKNGLRWAADSMLLLSDPAAKVSYAEHSGQCIEALRKTIAEHEERMDELAMRSMLESKPGNVTATAHAISSARATSELQRAWLRLCDATENALQFTAQLANIGGGKGGSICKTRKFFDLPAEQQRLEWIKFLREQKLISGKAVFSEAQRQDAVSDSLSYDEEQEAIGEEAPSLGSFAGATQLALRVVQLVKSGVDPDAAMAQAQAEDDAKVQSASGERVAVAMTAPAQAA